MGSKVEYGKKLGEGYGKLKETIAKSYLERRRFDFKYLTRLNVKSLGKGLNKKWSVAHGCPLPQIPRNGEKNNAQKMCVGF